MPEAIKLELLNYGLSGNITQTTCLELRDQSCRRRRQRLDCWLGRLGIDRASDVFGALEERLDCVCIDFTTNLWNDEI